MPLFNFDAEFKLGIEEIDAAHAGLINMLNEVHNHIRAGEKEKARHCFSQTLSAFLDEHFTHEEAYMQKLNFPQIDEHKKIHANFRRSMQESLARIDSLDETAFRDALTDTYTWIIHHIGKTDKKYVDFSRLD